MYIKNDNSFSFICQVMMTMPSLWWYVFLENC